jgi:Secretion system C-terminal sorting domain
VEPIGSGIPAEYALSQNYPNPFNPSTEIQFSVPRKGMTTLKVYDMLGRDVATLVREDLVPGTYKTRLDGSRLASGMYVYELTSADTRIVKKMMLLK